MGIPGGDEPLGKDLAMHIAASDPRFAGRAEVSAEILATEREIAKAQATAAGKPANVVERIADGKVEKFYQEAVLVEQPFVKDPEKTVGQIVVERAGKGALELRFVRFKLGEGLGPSPKKPTSTVHLSSYSPATDRLARRARGRRRLAGPAASRYGTGCDDFPTDTRCRAVSKIIAARWPQNPFTAASS